jgi:hypothetical protein
MFEHADMVVPEDAEYGRAEEQGDVALVSQLSEKALDLMR